MQEQPVRVSRKDQSTGGGGGGSGEEQGGDKALMWAVIALGSASTLWSLYKAGSAYMKARRILNEGAMDEAKLTAQIAEDAANIEKLDEIDADQKTLKEFEDQKNKRLRISRPKNKLLLRSLRLKSRTSEASTSQLGRRKN